MKKNWKVIVGVIAILIAICVLIAVFYGNKNTSNPILGEWEYKGSELLGYNFVYTFNADGTGTYMAADNKIEFTYTIKDNKISILYKDSTIPFETEYKIEGDKLDIIDSLGTDTIYVKK